MPKAKAETVAPVESAEPKVVELPKERINPRPDFPVQIKVVEGSSIDEKTGRSKTYKSIAIETPTGNIAGMYENRLHIMHSLMIHEKRDLIAKLLGEALVELAVAKGRKDQKVLKSLSC